MRAEIDAKPHSANSGDKNLQIPDLWVDAGQNAKSAEESTRLDAILLEMLTSDSGDLAFLNEWLAARGRKIDILQNAPGQQSPLSVYCYRCGGRDGAKVPHLVDRLDVQSPPSEENIRQLREFVLTGKTPLDEQAQREKQRFAELNPDSRGYDLSHLKQQLNEVDQMFRKGLFNEIDRNKDGYISQDEIKEFCGTNPESRSYAAALAVEKFSAKLSSSKKGVSQDDIHAFVGQVGQSVEKFEEAEAVRNVMVGYPGPGRPSAGFRGFAKILQKALESDKTRTSEFITRQDVKGFLDDQRGFLNKDQVYDERAHGNVAKVLNTLLTDPAAKLTVGEIKAFPGRIREENRDRFKEGIEFMKEFYGKF